MSKSLMNMMAGALALALVGLGQPARADDFVARDAQGQVTTANDRAGFGEAGQWTFSTDTTLVIQRETRSDSDGAVVKMSILPATDYFIIDNLSVGGVIGIEYDRTGDSRNTRFKLGPRVGYNFELSRLFSVWPKLGFSYAHGKYKIESTPNDTVYKTDTIALNLYAPLMVHPAPHFFAGFGPFLDTDLNGDNRATTWGFKLTLGGWL